MHCAVRFIVRLNKNSAGILTYVKVFLSRMTEKTQARHAPSREAVFVRCCLKYRAYMSSARINLNEFRIKTNTASDEAKAALPLHYFVRVGENNTQVFVHIFVLRTC